MAADARTHLGDGEYGSIIFDEETIQRRVAELGREICVYYESGELLLVGLLKGGFLFLADLVRNIPRPHKVDFCVVSSYGSGTKSSGNVRLLYDPTVDMKDHHVLLVEDVVETGQTLDSLVHTFRERDVLSVEIVTLLHKRMSSTPRCEPRFVGFDAQTRGDTYETQHHD